MFATTTSAGKFPAIINYEVRALITACRHRHYIPGSVDQPSIKYWLTSYASAKRDLDTALQAMQRQLRWWFFCLAVQLLAACAHSMRPVLRVPRDAPTTGRCTVAVSPSATEEEQQKLMTTVMKVSDDAKVYGYVDKVAKAFTVKLSPYALEIVRKTVLQANSFPAYLVHVPPLIGRPTGTSPAAGGLY